MTAAVIRPEQPGVTRRPIDVGQIWTVDDGPARWFVLTPGRIIALFAGASDHTPASLVHTYGDRLRLEQIASVYADERLGECHLLPDAECNGRDEHAGCREQNTAVADQLAQVRHRVAVWRALLRNMREMYGGQIDRLLDELDSLIDAHDPDQACCHRPGSCEQR